MLSCVNLEEGSYKVTLLHAAVLDDEVLVCAGTRVDVAGDGVVGRYDTALSTEARCEDCRLHVIAATGRVEVTCTTSSGISAAIDGPCDVHSLTDRTDHL